MIKKKEKFTVSINIKVTDFQRAFIDEICCDNDCNRSDLFRQLINDFMAVYKEDNHEK